MPQPITCDCPWRTAVFAGGLVDGAEAASGAIGVQALVEARPDKVRVSFVIATKGTVCTLLASEGASFDSGQECVDPSHLDTKIAVTGGEWSETADGRRLHVSYSWRRDAASEPARAVFDGTLVALPAAPADPAPLCGARPPSEAHPHA